MKTLQKESYMLNNDKHEFKAPRIIDNITYRVMMETGCGSNSVRPTRKKSLHFELRMQMIV